ncbi:uncharacterized protein LOC135834742 isoform X3 [Planococcus citri]|uniref:uncharacterized protein LOC135834742 isoform X3 n=1 Tax=Planococcus citri TaxID=170843 RepID=UPI0031F72E71
MREFQFFINIISFYKFTAGRLNIAVSAVNVSLCSNQLSSRCIYFTFVNLRSGKEPTTMKITKKQLKNPKFLESLRQPIILLTDFKRTPQTSNEPDTSIKHPIVLLTDFNLVPQNFCRPGTSKSTDSKHLAGNFTRRNTPKSTDSRRLPRKFTRRDESKNMKQPVILLTDLKHLPRTLVLPDSPNISFINGLGEVSPRECIEEGDISQTRHDTIQTINEENITQTEDLGSTSTRECIEDDDISQTRHDTIQTINEENITQTEDLGSTSTRESIEVENTSQTSHNSDEIFDGESMNRTEDNDEAIIDKNERNEKNQSNRSVNEMTSKSLISHAEVEYDRLQQGQRFFDWIRNFNPFGMIRR